MMPRKIKYHSHNGNILYMMTSLNQRGKVNQIFNDLLL